MWELGGSLEGWFGHLGLWSWPGLVVGDWGRRAGIVTLTYGFQLLVCFGGVPERPFEESIVSEVAGVRQFQALEIGGRSRASTRTWHQCFSVPEDYL